MQRPLKFIITGLVIIALLGAAPFFLRPYVDKLGEKSLELLARDGNFCETDTCEEGISYVIAFLETNYGLSEQEVKWCMGVDEISHYQLPFGNGLKNALTDYMYRRCGSPVRDIQDDTTPSDEHSMDEDHEH